jgi:Lrp/AsnC family transcriptional regulator for asnA, asnC and gidA
VQRKDKYRMAFIRVQAELERVPEICAELEAMDTVGALLVTMGRFNLLVVVLFDDLDELHEIAAGKILSRPGVHHVETAIAVDTVKYDVRIARIL